MKFDPTVFTYNGNLAAGAQIYNAKKNKQTIALSTLTMNVGADWGNSKHARVNNTV